MNKQFTVVLCTLALLCSFAHAEEPAPQSDKKTTSQESSEKKADTKAVVAPLAAPKLKDVLADTKSEEEQLSDINAVSADIPQDKYNRGTPRTSILSLSATMKKGDFEHGTEFLDMRNLPKDVAEVSGAELVRKLRIIAQRSFWIDIDTVSNHPEGHKDDGLPAYRDRIARINTVDGPVDILMQHVPGEDGEKIWKISNRTVAKIPELYAQYGYGEIGDLLSRTFPHYEFFTLQIWQWILLVVIVAIAFAISWTVTSFVNLLVRRFTKSTPRIQRFIAKPVRFFILVLIARANFDLLGPSLETRALFEANTLYIIAITWILMGLADVVLGRIGDRRILGSGQTAETLLRPTATAIKIAIVTVAVIMWLDNMGFQVTTLVAGLGVGSVAVALAAQKSIENFIGAITMYTAQPVRVGDFCRLGDTVGTVEELGLRATQVRTLDRSVVSIPNALLANAGIVNISKRDKYLYRRKIRLQMETSPNQLRYILVEVRKMLYSHPKVDPDPARVRFVEFGEHSLDMDIFAYINAADYNDFLGVSEDINLYIMDVIADSGSRLAIPAQSIQIAQANEVDENLVKDAEAKVEQWREKSALNLPEFSEESRDKLKGTLEYPQKGSITNPKASS